MKVVFVSNYYNHHQSSFSESMYELLNSDYLFIQTEKMDTERIKLGWKNEKLPSFVIDACLNANSYNNCKTLIDDADVVIFGSCPYDLIKNRLKNNKLTFLYAERIYKKGCSKLKHFYHIFKNYYLYKRFSSLYLLCASAYTYSDFSKTKCFKNKAYKWGYFPFVKEYQDIEKIIDNKSKNSILWCARFIDWKHPEVPILIADRLKKDGYNFTLNMIGCGEMEEKIKTLIYEKQLENHVHILGSMSPEEVRENMEKSQIFLFTSDFNEGWGAVLNESMNSACSVISNHAIGSTPFLIKNNKNGLIYKNGDIEDLYRKIKFLLDNKEKQVEFSKNAYETMFNVWNSKIASKRFVNLCESILSGNINPDLYKDGVCSKAEILDNNWYK